MNKSKEFSMRKVKIGYWIFTGLLATLMLMSSIPNILSAPSDIAVFNHLGSSAYLVPFIGVGKLLGVIAILVPGFPRIKEWAYASLVIDLTGVFYSSVVVGYPASGWIIFFIGYCWLLCFLSQKTKRSFIKSCEIS